MKISHLVWTLLIVLLSCRENEVILPEEQKQETAEAPRYTEIEQPVFEPPAKPLQFLVLNDHKVERPPNEVNFGNGISSIGLSAHSIRDIVVDYWLDGRRVVFRNAAIIGNEVYLLLYIGNEVVRASLLDGKVIASRGEDENFWVAHNKSIVHHNKEVIVAFTRLADTGRESLTYLSIYDDQELRLKKEIEIAGDGYTIEQMMVADNQLLLLLSHYERMVLQSYDLDSKTLTYEKELGYGFFELQSASSSEFFLYSGEFLNTLNAKTFEEVNQLKIRGSIPYMGDNPTFFYDEAERKIYFFRIAPQPSITPYYLMVYDFNTENTDYINLSDLIISGAIYYDMANRTLLLTSGNTISSISMEGELLQIYTHQYRIKNIYPY